MLKNSEWEMEGKAVAKFACLKVLLSLGKPTLLRFSNCSVFLDN